MHLQDEAESKIDGRHEGKKRSVRQTLAAYEEAKRKCRAGTERRTERKQLPEQTAVRKRGRIR